MAKAGTTITKANVKTKKVNRYTKDDCVKEITRLKEGNQDNCEYYFNVVQQAKSLGVSV